MDSTGLLIMYKIYSKDGKYMYVNNTKNFEARKEWHKEVYLYEEDPWNKTLLYRTVRENGGFENFIIEPIEYGYFDDIEKVIKREIPTRTKQTPYLQYLLHGKSLSNKSVL